MSDKVRKADRLTARCGYAWHSGLYEHHGCVCRRLKGHSNDHRCGCGRRIEQEEPEIAEENRRFYATD